MAMILVAEDSPDNLDILGELLRGEGYTVVTADNKRDAIAIAKREQPRLILMDLQMPDAPAASALNSHAGLEAARALRADPIAQSIPIIALTGYDGVDLRREIEAAGCDAIGSKPYDFPVLLQTIANLIETA